MNLNKIRLFLCFGDIFICAQLLTEMFYFYRSNILHYLPHIVVSFSTWIAVSLPWIHSLGVSIKKNQTDPSACDHPSHHILSTCDGEIYVLPVQKLFSFSKLWSFWQNLTRNKLHGFGKAVCLPTLSSLPPAVIYLGGSAILGEWRNLQNDKAMMSTLQLHCFF